MAPLNSYSVRGGTTYAEAKKVIIPGRSLASLATRDVKTGFFGY